MRKRPSRASFGQRSWHPNSGSSDKRSADRKLIDSVDLRFTLLIMPTHQSKLKSYGPNDAKANEPPYDILESPTDENSLIEQ